MIPQHVGIIPDGNRRWAQKNLLNFSKAYNGASENLLRITKHLFVSGVKYVSFYGFSLKNFERNAAERKIILALIKKRFSDMERLVDELGVRMHFAGRLELFPEDVRDMFSSLEKKTRKNRGGALVALVGYDGVDELDYAAERMKEHGGTLRENMFVPVEVPPLDLVIRTSGEKRISGFLPYLASYAELYFSDKLWPDFTEADLKEALQWYSECNRRFGR
jgi:undecaprenyl diphosphate synthase